MKVAGTNFDVTYVNDELKFVVHNNVPGQGMSGFKTEAEAVEWIHKAVREGWFPAEAN